MIQQNSGEFLPEAFQNFIGRNQGEMFVRTSGWAYRGSSKYIFGIMLVRISVVIHRRILGRILGRIFEEFLGRILWGILDIIPGAVFQRILGGIMEWIPRKFFGKVYGKIIGIFPVGKNVKESVEKMWMYL